MDLLNDSLSASPTSEARVGAIGGESAATTKNANTLVFGRYILQRVLGRGGMGIVWQARDIKLERLVALKFVPDLVSADPVAVRELKDETRRGLDLAHPHIVRIYDFVDDAENAAIVMEFVDGKSLAELRLAEPQRVFKVTEIGPWIAQVCEALDYAHLHRRLIHRDLKPANILLEAGNIKITDFGIARQVSDTVSRLSMAQAKASGTLLYMSPQQTMGDRPRPTDDVYSLGACIFELLTGKPPFYTGDVTVQILHKRAHRIAERLEELEITPPAAIPEEWEEAVASCLDKSPGKRPQSAGELAVRLGLASPSATTRNRLISIAPTTPSIASAAETSAELPPLDSEKTVRSTPIPVSSEPAPLGRASFRLHWVSLLVGVAVVVLTLGGVWWTHLQHAPGSLLLYSDPDQVRFEVAPTDPGSKVAKISGQTPKTVQLPPGHYRLTMTHDGESKSTDVNIGPRVEVAKSFKFVSAVLTEEERNRVMPPLLLRRANPVPEFALTAPKAPLLAAANPLAEEVEPNEVPAEKNSKVLTPPSEFKPLELPQEPAAPPVAESEGPKPDQPKEANAAEPGAAAADVPLVEPAEGYWKLDELFADSDYKDYSENGRHYILFRVQKALKEKDLYSSGLDGREGKGTHHAIESYQKANHLPASGQLDNATLASLSLTDLPDKSEWTPPVHHGTASRNSAPQGNWWERNVQNPLKHIFQR